MPRLVYKKAHTAPYLTFSLSYSEDSKTDSIDSLKKNPATVAGFFLR